MELIFLVNRVLHVCTKKDVKTHYNIRISECVIFKFFSQLKK